MIRHATLNAHIQGLEGLFMVNGVPQSAWTEATAATLCRNGAVARWLRAGQNTLTAIFQRGRSSGVAKLEASIQDGRGTSIASVERADGAATNGVLECSFELEDGSATKLWSEAEPLGDSGSHRAEVSAELARIRGAILDRDTASLLKLRAYALRDEAALRSDLFAGRDWTRFAHLVHEGILSDRTLTLAPFPAPNMRWEVVGDGRILSVWTGERTPAIRFVDGDGACASSMELHFARIDGRLRWVR